MDTPRPHLCCPWKEAASLQVLSKASAPCLGLCLPFATTASLWENYVMLAFLLHAPTGILVSLTTTPSAKGWALNDTASDSHSYLGKKR